jgi:hypothetical protein
MFYEQGAAHCGVYLPDAAAEQYRVFSVQGSLKKFKASGFENPASGISALRLAALHNGPEHFYFRFHGSDYSNHKFRVAKIRLLCNG